MLLASGSCKESTVKMTGQSAVDSKKNLLTYDLSQGYDFRNPTQTFELSKKLKEISGLAYDNVTNRLWSHNDEKGVFHELDINSGKILSSQKFSKSGDYEAIAIVGDEVVVASHSGKLHFYNRKSNETDKLPTLLSPKNDIEGLCYSPETDKLMIACKGHSIGHKKRKSIYAFDLSSGQLDQSPLIEIRNNQLPKWIDDNQDKYKGHSLTNLKDRVGKFAPSGLSLDRSGNRLFLISARGSTLLIYDVAQDFGDSRSSEAAVLESVIFLDEKMIPQPEGITFDTDNNLYISSEGKNGKGEILKFNFRG